MGLFGDTPENLPPNTDAGGNVEGTGQANISEDPAVVNSPNTIIADAVQPERTGRPEDNPQPEVANVPEEVQAKTDPSLAAFMAHMETAGRMDSHTKSRVKKAFYVGYSAGIVEAERILKA